MKKWIKKLSQHTLLIYFTVVIAAIAIAGFCYWFFYGQYHEYTDDAYANGNLININSSISGSAVAFFADDTDLVAEGQLLVVLDPTEYQIAYEKELAKLASVVLQVRQIYDMVEVNRALVKSKRSSLSVAKFDYQNRAMLIGSGAVSNEEYIHSKDALSIAEFELKQAEEQLKVSEDSRGNTRMETHPLIEEQKSHVRKACYDLQHCSIYAPATGYIAKRSVNVGQWITPANNMMALIPSDYVWVDANYKETQLTYMRIGQPATVTFDLYGDVEFKGKVLGISSGSGSVFSLIPPQNATGNWIKIVQRLPVRISLDPDMVKKYPIRLGISAEVDVDITDQSLPRLSHIPSIKSVGATQVFDIHLERVDQIINQVIQENLKKGNEQP